jgi:hypothetical protein
MLNLTKSQLSKLTSIAHSKNLLVKQYIKLLIINAIKLNNSN